jgi:beta-lactamase regulating signal transducer with metallopeptidase domain
MLAILMAIGLWPDVLAPLGRAYVLFCARFLLDAPFRHHFPPLFVAFVGLIFLFLAAGFVIALARQIVGQRELHASLSTRECEPDAHARMMLAKLGVEDRTVVTDDAGRAYAFCSGLIQPQMYLSHGLLRLLSPNEIEAVVRHELHHLQRRDPLRLFLGSLGARLACVMPILATLDRRLRIRIELAADREVVSVLGFEAVATALVKVARASPVIDHRVVMATFSPTEARVAALLGDDIKVAFRWQDLATSAFFLASLLVLSVWLALQSLPLPPECLVCPPF